MRFWQVGLHDEFYILGEQGVCIKISDSECMTPDGVIRTVSSDAKVFLA